MIRPPNPRTRPLADDGEDDPPAEPVEITGPSGRHRSFLPGKDQTHVLGQVQGNPLFLEEENQGVPGSGSKPQSVLPDRFFGDSPLGQILSPLFSLSLGGQDPVEIFGGGSIHFVQFRLEAAAALLLLAQLLRGKGHVVPLGHGPNRLGKAHLARAHEEVENIPARPAAEAVKDPLLLVHREGGGSFRMERAEPQVVLPRFLQGDIIGDHFHDAGALPDFVDFIFGDQVTHRSSAFGPHFVRPAMGRSIRGGGTDFHHGHAVSPSARASGKK
jgi:hypothetical protein